MLRAECIYLLTEYVKYLSKQRRFVTLCKKRGIEIVLLTYLLTYIIIFFDKMWVALKRASCVVAFVGSVPDNFSTAC